MRNCCTRVVKKVSKEKVNENGVSNTYLGGDGATDSRCLAGLPSSDGQSAAVELDGSFRVQHSHDLSSLRRSAARSRGSGRLHPVNELRTDTVLSLHGRERHCQA